MPKILLLIIFLIFSYDINATEITAESMLAQRYIVKKNETLYNIAKLFDLGFEEILQANPKITDKNSIPAGEEIILPVIHLLPDVKEDGIAINLAELRLYFFSDDDVKTFPITIGADEQTPLGKTKIIAKKENPSWIPPASIRQENPKLPEIVFPGPNNPLGNHALYLDSSRDYKWQNILIHGTNASWTIGSKVSHGCIRLYPQDIEELYNKVEIDTPVIIVNQPLKILEIDEKVYLEIHLEHAPDVVFENLGVKKLICKKIKDCEVRINWQKTDDAVIANLGIPVEISN